MLTNKENQHFEAKTGKGDRFIPQEIHSCAFEVQYHRSQRQTPSSEYQKLLERGILDEIDQRVNHKIMTFTQNTVKTTTHRIQSLCGMSTRMPKKQRKVNKKPYKVLDAPNLQDDFYLNLLDWSDRNQIAVALDDSLYLWSGCSTQISRLYQTSQINDYLCSVQFCDDHKIAVGNSLGQIRLFDINKKKKIASFEGHYGRVGSLDYCNGLLASGSRDGYVIAWDQRIGQVAKYKAHSQEICGIKWSPDGQHIASGGNDNKLVVYSARGSNELVRYHEHKAAVKAIGWCPSQQGMIASGGGTADRHIRFFSTNDLKESYSIDTGSQICNLAFSKISNQMVTTHGYSLNQINLWSTTSNWEEKSVNKIATLTGHSYRVLYLASSPSGESILTGAGDETLRFWNVFDSSKHKKHQTLGFQMDLR